MFEVFNNMKIKKAIENNRNEIPVEWKELCILKIGKYYGGAYPQFETTEELEDGIRKANWKRSKEIMIPENCELYTSDLTGQVELIRLDSLSRDTLLYFDKVNETDTEGTLYVKGLNPGKINKTYLILEKIEKKYFVKYFSTGEYDFASKITANEYKSGAIITKQEAVEMNVEILKVKNIGLGINNKVPIAIRRTKKLDKIIWEEGCKDLISRCYTSYRTIFDFEKALVNADWNLNKRGLSDKKILRYETNTLLGCSETVKLASLPTDVELTICRTDEDNESTNAYLQATTSSKSSSRITILDVAIIDDYIIVNSINCGMPVTEVNKGAERYRHGERISKREAMSLGFQYVLV